MQLNTKFITLYRKIKTHFLQFSTSHSHTMMMRKAFYYNFFPTKAEEEALAARNARHVVTRTLVDIRGWSSNSVLVDPNSPWQIRRVVTRKELETGEIMVSHDEMIGHVLKSWNLELANHIVVKGNKCLVKLVDYTDGKTPKAFQSCYIKIGPYLDTYVVGLMDVFRSRVVNPGDEIGLFWDTRPASYGFRFKLLRRGNNH